MTDDRAMKRLLVINPNTTESVSALLRRHVQGECGAGVQVDVLTARFGAPYISCEASYAVAAHAVLDAWGLACAQGPRPDAVLIGCFGDPGLLALQQGAGVPVSGLAQAAFDAAARRGRFAVVTGGARWAPMLERLANALGMGENLAGIHTVAPSGAQLAADPQGARALLAEACRHAAAQWQVDAVILGGAGLAGMAADIAASVPVPLIDSVLAGARWGVQAVALPRAQLPAAGFGVAWHNVSGALARLP